MSSKSIVAIGSLKSFTLLLNCSKTLKAFPSKTSIPNLWNGAIEP